MTSHASAKTIPWFILRRVEEAFFEATTESAVNTLEILCSGTLSHFPKPTGDLRRSIAGFVFYLRYTLSNEFFADATEIVFVSASYALAAFIADKAVIDGVLTVLAEVHCFLAKNA